MGNTRKLLRRPDSVSEQAEADGTGSAASPTTNFTLFRDYLASYLSGRADIRDDLPLMVRPLEATPTGLPLQVYAFTNTSVWPEFEAIQASVLDHVIASAREFDLRIFQLQSDNDGT